MKCAYCDNEVTMHVDHWEPETRARLPATYICDSDVCLDQAYGKERAMTEPHAEIEDLGYCTHFELTSDKLGAKAIIKLSPNGGWVKINEGLWVQIVVSDDATFVNGKKIENAESSGN